jgi:magnesium transporter
MSKKLRAFSLRVQKIKNNDIVQFVNTENILYDFNTSLVRINNIYDGMLSGKILTLTEHERDLIEDVSLATNQLIQITRENLRTTVNVREAYSTIMTNNLNQVIKLFTSLTVILTLPTILGTYYGMNVSLPFQDSPAAFFGIVAFSLAAATVAIFIFLRKDWL